VRVGAVVPAAGRSRRMAAEKILLPFGGSTMLGAVLEKLNGAGVSPVVAILRADLPEARRIAEAAGARVRINPDPDAEMLVSIRLGVEMLLPDADALFIWPADHPAVDPATLRRLLADATRDSALLPVHAGRRGHPALVGADLLAGIAGIPANEGLRRLWRDRADAVREIEVADPGVIENLDDPDAYRDAREREEKRPPS
jgi:molybdenum cofactor cytidylyltransferase